MLKANNVFINVVQAYTKITLLTIFVLLEKTKIFLISFPTQVNSPNDITRLRFLQFRKSGKFVLRKCWRQQVRLAVKFANASELTRRKTDKNSSEDEIANVNVYAVRPEGTRIC